jgi:uncharacterized protein YrrD
MEKYLSQIVGMPVVSENGQPLSRILDLCLNTDTGKVVGFLLAPAGQTVIAPIDVIDFDNGLIINDQDDIIPANEIHQIAALREKNIRILGNKVITKDGTYLGKVTNYAIHSKFLTLTKIIATKSLLGIIRYGRLIIGSKDIIEIKKDGIIVKNLVEPLVVKKLKPDMAPTI